MVSTLNRRIAHGCLITPYRGSGRYDRGAGTGPAGPALAGPIFFHVYTCIECLWYDLAAY